MAGETQLNQLLKNMSPQLDSQDYVFCSIKGGKLENVLAFEPLATFQEKEGLTLVLTAEKADANGLGYEGKFRCITLQVHSSLEAVGLTAAVATQLTQNQVSANVIAAYYHDHIFVPEQDAQKAVEALLELTQ